MKRVNLLKNNGIIPVIVFDGANLPMKSITEKDRLEGRKARKAKGLDFLKAGDRAKAEECFRTCIDITPCMAFEFIKALKANGIEFVVAPYEADAQLAFMNLNCMISAVLTEDSDLLSFGCTKVLYKLDQSGHCIEILQSDLGNVREMKSWTPARFREMCILAGCDYLPNLPGIGVKTAIKYLERVDVYSLIKSWRTWGSAVKAPKMPPDYLHRFQLADYTFQFQRVYDPKKEQLVTLRPIPPNVLITTELMYAIGPEYDPITAKGVAEGFLNPDTKLPFLNNDSTKTVLSENNRLATNSLGADKSFSKIPPRTNPHISIFKSNFQATTSSLKMVNHNSTNRHVASVPLQALPKNNSHAAASSSSLKNMNQNVIGSVPLQAPPKTYSQAVASSSRNMNQNATNHHIAVASVHLQAPLNLTTAAAGGPNTKSILPTPPVQQVKGDIIVVPEEDSNVKSIASKPPIISAPASLSNPQELKSIRYTHTKTVIGGFHKIVPARRKAEAVSSREQNSQTKIIKYFGTPRLSPHFPPPSAKPPLTPTLTTNTIDSTSKSVSAPTFAADTFNFTSKPPLTSIISENGVAAANPSKPVGVFNLFRPPKPRRIGLAPPRKKENRK